MSKRKISFTCEAPIKFSKKKYDLNAGIDRIISTPPPFGSVGYITYKRTYSRLLNDSGVETEEWHNTIKRVVTACNDQLKCNFTVKEQIELFNILYNLKCSVAGRFLWQLNTNTVDKLGLLSLQNCAVTAVDNISAFTWAMDCLMLGVGVGFNIQMRYVRKLPDIKHVSVTRNDVKDADFIIPDSREGWIKIIGKVIKAHFVTGEDFTYSAMLIRSKGAPIKSFGGVASGPDVLCNGVKKINEVLNKRAGQYARPIDCLDVMNIIGMIVVAGNVRRCLVAGTLIHTSEGLIPIEDVKPGMYAYTYKGAHLISELLNQGLQQIITITTQLGKFNCTPNHKMAVYDKVDSYIWKNAIDLSTNDKLVFSEHIIPGTNTSLPESEFYDKDPNKRINNKKLTVPVLDDDMAWLIGYLYGSSYIYQSGRNKYVGYLIVAPIIKRQEIIIKCKKILNKFDPEVDFNTSSITETLYGDDHILNITHKELVKYLSKIKLSYEEYKVPNFILRGTYNIRFNFLAGLFDGCGSYTKDTILISSVYYNYVKQVQALYASIGIISKFKSICISYKSLTPRYELNLINGLSSNNFDKYIGSNSYRYNKLTPAVTNNNSIVPIDILSIDNDNNFKDTFDISVPDTNEFAVDFGLLVHNSAQLAIGDSNDLEFLSAKRWDSGNIPNWRCHSNNSVNCSNIDDLPKEFWEGYIGNGEPYGLINMDLSRKCGRLGETQYPDPNIIGYNPCAEQSLDDKETCCLADVFLPNITSPNELWRCVKYLYRINKHSLRLNCHQKETEKKVHSNVRMGIGITGYLQSTETQRGWLSDCYIKLRAFDKEYSRLKGIPESIKLTTVKPSGCMIPTTVVKTNKGNLQLSELFKLSNISINDTDINKWHDPISDIKIYNKDNKLENITKLYINGVSDVMTFTLEDNTVITCTPDHKFLLTNGEWRMCKDLQINDDIKSF